MHILKNHIRLVALATFGLLLTPVDNHLLADEPYFGQDPPGLEPEVFAPGLVSTEERRELNPVWGPHGNTFYFSYSDGAGHYQIMMMQKRDGAWSEITPASFSEEFSNVDFSLSHDGRFGYFGSDRPRPGQSERRSDGFDIWIVDWSESGWSEPRHAGYEVNSNPHQVYPSVTKSGSLYFQSNRPGGFGGTDIYRTRLVNGIYTQAENLGRPVNTDANEGDVFIAPDESYLIVSSWGRADSLGSGDLYISFRKEDGSWTEATNMGPDINSSAIDFTPHVSPDGKYLFFSSGRRGTPDIFWVDAKIIDRYR